MASGNYVALPGNMDGRLRLYLARRYPDRIRVVKTSDYDSLLVQRVDGRIARVVTQEGVGLVADTYVDMDPEARVTEKAGVAMSVETPELASGLVFTVVGFRRNDRATLQRAVRLPVEQVFRLAGVAPEVALREPAIAKALRRYRRRTVQDFLRLYDFYGLGWTCFAEGFNLYMQCLELRHPSPELRWLNSRRTTSGFNVAFGDGWAVFNGISYYPGPDVLQHSHDLLREPRWAAIRNLERRELVRYLSEVVGLKHVTVVLPRQFYVRRASAYFRTVKPYTAEEFGRPDHGRYWMAYPNDYRDIRERDVLDRELLRKLRTRRALYRWTCRPSSALTSVPNLYSLNKSAMPPEFFGCLRILQNLVTTGVALAEELAMKRYGPFLARSGRTMTTQRFVSTRRASPTTSSAVTVAKRFGRAVSLSKLPVKASASASARARSVAR